MIILLSTMIYVIYTFDLPGIQQKMYSEGEQNSVLINEMTSQYT